MINITAEEVVKVIANIISGFEEDHHFWDLKDRLQNIEKFLLTLE